MAGSAALLSWHHGARLRVRTRARVVGKRARALLYFYFALLYFYFTLLYSIEVRGLGSVLPSEG